ncbi:hypothetical protein CQ019_16395 [Arthrobacter sp. MYb229]|uniref:hypothetical protein n=1 Tax=unclassified Arthrobacter TaxID=235627 RepID=UPI000CFD46A0|nr:MULTISPECIES: hypothetical protein [unclassified Arthrobacter]PQZ99137.1 hypothetical protein CQ019_16395 [Arthrobacter sp. MYb229]PRB47522.1 hypothetical protein CQ013_16420 [Arthrobacter sp. MYb216]
MTKYGSQPTRPISESIAEAVALVVASSVVIFGLISINLEGGEIDQTVPVAREFGAAILDEIGWICGFYLTILIGFYVVTISGQIRGISERATRTSRTLGLYATFIVGAIVPALVLCVMAAIGDPEKLGKLVVAVPALVVLIVMSLTLSGFAVNDKKVQLKIAEIRLKKSIEDGIEYRERSKIKTWKVLVFEPLVLSFILWICCLIFYRPEFSIGVVVLFVLLLVLSGGYMLLCFGLLTSFSPRNGKIDKYATVAIALLSALFSILLISIFVEAAGIFPAIIVLFTFIVPLAMLIWPRAIPGGFLYDWSLRAVASRYLAKKAALNRASARLQIRSIISESNSSAG